MSTPSPEQPLDHLAAALELLSGVRSLPTVECVARAQVSATLYLAEQQRIANFIAYRQMLTAEYADAREDPDGWDFASFWPSVSRFESAGRQIREGLGLA